MVSMPRSIASRAERIDDLLAAHVDLAAVDRMDAGDRLDQRRLAGAVVAEQRHDLAFAQRDRRALQRAARCRRTSADPVQAEDFRCHGHRRLPRSSGCSACRMSMTRMMRADEDVVGEARHADQHDAVADGAQHERADDGAEDGAAAAGQRRAADHDHGDDFQLVAGAGHRRGGRDAEGADHAGKAGKHRGQDEQPDLDGIGRHAARDRRVAVGADGADPVAELGIVEDVGRQQRQRR